MSTLTTAPHRITITDADIPFDLFDRSTFQRAVDQGFEEIFKVPNAGHYQVSGVITPNPTAEHGFMHIKRGDCNHVYTGTFSYQDAKDWLEGLKHLHTPQLTAETSTSGRLTIRHVPEDRAAIAQRLRDESHGAICHEMEHLGWEVLTEKQRDSLVNEVKRRVPGFEGHRLVIQKSYESIGRNFRTPSEIRDLEALTCNELIAETRRLCVTPHDYALMSYVESSHDSFMELAPLIQLMDFVAANYAKVRGIPSPPSAFRTQEQLKHGLFARRQSHASNAFELLKLPEPGVLVVRR